MAQMDEAQEEKLWIEAETVGRLNVSLDGLSTILNDIRLTSALSETHVSTIKEARNLVDSVIRDLETKEEYR